MCLLSSYFGSDVGVEIGEGCEIGRCGLDKYLGVDFFIVLVSNFDEQ